MSLPYGIELSIIIVNWNSKEFLMNCLASVETQTSGVKYEIVVIDSGSFDGCEQMLKESYPHVLYLQSDSNIGFAKANNVAFRASVGDHVLFLNPDTKLVGPAVSVMMQYLRELPEAGAVGCRLLNSDGSLQTTCVQAFPTIVGQFVNSHALRAIFPRWSIWGTEALYGASDRPTKVEAISGACIMLKRRVFEDVGLFSEEYFMYAEDIDLCYKVRQAGYASYYIPEATVLHFGGGSSDKAPSEFAVVMMRKSILQFLNKTRGSIYGLTYRASTALLAITRLSLLLFLWPLPSAQRNWQPWSASFKRWRAILRWSLGTTSLANHDK
jgi:N-acetylglucosaminyl-diphospho-decaprenol L-rhamnosyltransferase